VLKKRVYSKNRCYKSRLNLLLVYDEFSVSSALYSLRGQRKQYEKSGTPNNLTLAPQKTNISFKTLGIAIFSTAG
jgi:hypothetical protein